MKSGNETQTLELIHKTEQQGYYAWPPAYGSFLKCDLMVLVFCNCHSVFTILE